MADKNFIVKNGLEVGGQEVVSSSGVVTSAALGGQTLASTDSPTFNNLTLTNDIAVGGDLNLTGDLNITGDVNSLSVTDLDVTDQTITLGAGQVESASGGSGIVVDGSGASILWDETNTEWDFNTRINVPSAFSQYYSIRESGTQYGFIGQYKTLAGTGTDTSLTIFSETGDGINFAVNGSVTKAVVIDAEGDVGIGTTSPSSYDSRSNNLVVGDSGDAGITIFSGATSNARLQFAPSGSTGLDNGLIDYDNNDDSMAFATAGTERMRIDSSGNVGIGNISPSPLYWPNGSTGGLFLQAGALLSAYNAGTNLSQNYYYNAGEKFIGNGGASRYVQSGQEHIWSHSTAVNSSGAGAGLTWSESMRIDDEGYVGIGTSFPTSQLDVRGVFHVGASANTTPVIGRSLAPSGSQGLFLTAGLVSGESTTTPTFADNSSSGASIYLGGNAVDQYGGSVVLKAYGAGADGNLIVFENRSGTNTFKETMRIDSAGYITTPAQPYIRCAGNFAGMAANQGTSADFSNWANQVQRGITRSGAIFTVPKAGEYLITYSFYNWINNSGPGITHAIFLKKNNSTVQETVAEYDFENDAYSYYDNQLQNSLILNMAAGDTFRFSTNADIYGGSVHTNMSAYLLG